MTLEDRVQALEAIVKQNTARIADLERECKALEAADGGLLRYVQLQVLAIRALEEKVSKMSRIVC